MNGWILYVGEAVTELQRAVEEAAASGLEIAIIDPKDVDCLLDCDCTALFVRGERAPLPQFVIAGFIAANDYYNAALLQNLETLGVLCVNTADTLRNTGDKLRTHQLLAAAGLPCPRTLLLRPGMSAGTVIRHLGLPLVLKVLRGSRGQGVILVNSAAELDNLLQLTGAVGLGDELLAQQYIAQSRGRDVRVLVIDRKPRVAMLRASADAAQFRSNLAQGGAPASYPLTDEIRALAQRVIDTLGLNIGGIDLLFHNGGFLVCEANSIPGFKGIESCQDLNVPKEIFRSLARQLAGRTASPIQTRALLRDETGGESLCARLAGSDDLELLSRFRGLCEQPAQTQERVLLDIVRQNACSEFGAAHDFAAVQSIADFRARVPIADWEAFAPLAERMAQGEADLLFAGKPRHFIVTSGTTGREKLIPESDCGSLAKTTTSRLRIAALAALVPSVMQGKFIPLSNGPALGQTPGGIPYGTASGLTLEATPQAIRRQMAFPPDLYRIADQAAFDYVLMLFALGADVRAVVTNNAGRAEQLFALAGGCAEALIRDLEHGEISARAGLDDDTRLLLQGQLRPNPERAATLRALVDAGQFTPRYYWPGLALFSCWLAGSVGRFTGSIRPLLPPGCVLIDCGYGASEGKFNVPLCAEQAAGPLALHGYFFEFLPVEGGEPCLAHELREGAAYGLVVTNWSGLYRYDMHDIIRVEGFTGQTPNVRFEAKSGDVANIAGEKLSGGVIGEAIAGLPPAWQRAIRHYALWPDEAGRTYRLCVEPAGADLPAAAVLQEAFEGRLTAASYPYELLRGQGMLQPCEVVLMRAGWQASLYASRTRPGQTAAQVKLPIILREGPDPRMIADPRPA